MLKRLLISFLMLAFFWFQPAFSNVSSTAIMLEVKGPIGPPSVSYIEMGLKDAASRQSPLLILQLDTPGGLDASMRQLSLIHI